MDKIIAIHGVFLSPICDLHCWFEKLCLSEEDSDLICQPGVGWTEINEVLKEKDIPLFFPVRGKAEGTPESLVFTPVHSSIRDPRRLLVACLALAAPGVSAILTVVPHSLITPSRNSQRGPLRHSKGWMVPECGEHTVNFCRGMLISPRQTVVLPSGEVIKTRRRSRKSSAGFDTTKLFIGAEGTLGIVTEMTIRLAPVVPTTVATVRFPNMRKASEAVIEILNTGIGIRALFL
jgi:D-lactate dehydrogenase (cytochrome)